MHVSTAFKYKKNNLDSSNTKTDFIPIPVSISEEPHGTEHFVNSLKEEFSSDLQQIFSILGTYTGHDFSSYKLNTIYRRIEMRMSNYNILDLSQYVCLLKEKPEEVNELFKSLLIGVTSFFRDTDAFDGLKFDVLLKLLQSKKQNYCIRIWVPACSTGEEVYSIAMVLHECMDELKQYYHVQIFGTDIDVSALEVARAGVYPETIAMDVTPDRLSRFFIKTKNTYRIKKEIRQMVIFGEQNILKDPPFTKVELISCRNLLIYFNVELQKKLIPLLHYSLRSQGILFLGMSESIGGSGNLFKLIDPRWKIFERKDAPFAALQTFPDLVRSFDVKPVCKNDNVLNNNPESLIGFINKFFLDYPRSPCAVVNNKGDVCYIEGKVNNYLLSVTDPIFSNVFSLAHTDLKHALSIAFHKATIHKKEIIYESLEIKSTDTLFTLNLKVLPMTGINYSEDMFLIVFEELITPVPIKPSTNSSALVLSNKICELQHELHDSKAKLESTNEQLQFTKEEFQSTNEEIVTTKEELQVLNDELISLNIDLQQKIDQLASANDDVTNLFNSTGIATIFLDKDLCIKRFTPKAQDFIYLLKTDIGRSISHFATNIQNNSLTEDIQEVLNTLVETTFDIQTKDDDWYHMRILPYRTTSNTIDGVVITFIEITTHKNAGNLMPFTETLKDMLDETKNILDALSE